MLLRSLFHPMHIARLRMVESADLTEQTWVHFADVPKLGFNPKQFHQDPLAVYFFPVDFQPNNMWGDKTYKFTARLKPGAKVLDWTNISDSDLNNLLDRTGAMETYQAEVASWLRHSPPLNRGQNLRTAWHAMRTRFRAPAWTKAFISLGWDALYDDSGTIHSSEPRQLMVFNPRVIMVTDMQRIKLPVFASMQKVVKDIVDLAAPFGEMTITPPKRVKDRWSSNSLLQARVNIQRGDDTYADIDIVYGEHKSRRSLIDAAIRYSNPTARASLTFDIQKQAYEQYGGLDAIKHALEQVFR